MALRQSPSSLVALAAVCTLGLGIWTLPPTASRAEQNSPKIKWEYSTSKVRSEGLQAELNRYADDGWDVFSIERANSQLEQTPDNVNHIRTIEFQVTGRRQR